MKFKTIAISLGDPGGIGAEITLKSIIKPQFKDVKFALFGEFESFKKEMRKTKTKVVAKNEVYFENEKNIFVNISTKLGKVKLGQICGANGDIAIQSLDFASDAVMKGACDALVTAPLHKQAIKLAGYPFEGHTEFLQEKAKSKKVVMLLVGGGLKVALLTRHVAYQNVPTLISKKEIIEVTSIVNDALKKYWKVKKPLIGVLGLNPHASDGGLFGSEEKKIIEPAIKALQKLKINVMGPIPPDTAFHQALKQQWDAEICMYHDQGLIPLKTLAFDTGVNITLGMSFIRTSPDHGTAFDIVGKGIASEASMVCAIEQAVLMC
jgi:4-hydroxythreonine-4-phosphate dehydrogenase